MLVLHGENQVASRSFLINLKHEAVKAGRNPVDLPGDGLSLSVLKPALGGQSLFGATSAIFVEGFFSRRPSTEKKEVVSYLAVSLPKNLVMWEPKDVSTQLKDFPVEATRKFDLPKHVFKFLDQLSLPALELASTTTSAEMIMALLVGRIRQLIMVKDGQIASLPGWQAAKLRSQTDKYTLGQLQTVYLRLLDLDLAQKTSAVPYGLAAALELWVVRL